MEENIERPVRGAAFHAEGEWAVPEGYEAEIKDGKIIVRKKESEDETIRKNIISFLESHVPDSPTSCIGKTQMINWLERQKEQKPAEWSEEVKKKIVFLERLIMYNVPEGTYSWVDGHKGGYVTKQEAISMLKSIRPVKQEWSEEDEKIRSAILLMMKVPRKEIFEAQGITKEQALDWLEKQKFHTEGDFGRGYDCGYQACLNSHGAEWFEKQKEQIADYPYMPGWRKNHDDNKPELKRSVLMLTTHGVAEGEWLGEKWCQYRWSCELKDNEVLYWMNLSDLDKLEKEEHQCDCEHVGCHINHCGRWCQKFNMEVPYECCDPTCRGYSHKNTGGISVQKPTWTGNDSVALVSLEAIINNSNHDEARKKELLDWIHGRLGPQDGELMWLFAKAGTKFPADALVVGSGEDKDPRIVRCAVNDCYYLVVSDILPRESVTDAHNEVTKIS